MAKYCGPGIAAISMMGRGGLHGRCDPAVSAHDRVWRMRNAAGL